MEDAYHHPKEDVLKFFNVSESLGLSQEEVRKNRKKYGLNGKDEI